MISWQHSSYFSILHISLALVEITLRVRFVASKKNSPWKAAPSSLRFSMVGQSESQQQQDLAE